MIAQSTRFSLSDLALGFAAASLILGAFVATDFFATCVVVLLLALIALHVWRYTSSVWFRSLCWFTVVISSLFLALQLAAGVFLKIGSVRNPGDWPDPIQELVSVVGAPQSEVKVYCVEDFVDTEHVARLPFGPKDLDRLFLSLEGLGIGNQVREVPAGSVAKKFREAFPWWWRPSLRGNIKFYSPDDFYIDGRGPDGEYALFMHDADKKLLYVWYKFNF